MITRLLGAACRVRRVALLVGVWAAGVVARDVGRDDPGVVVIDEVVGMFITLATQESDQDQGQ